MTKPTYLYHNVLSLLFLVIFVNANGQFYYAGQSNPSKKLVHIETEHFDVVFPKGYEYEGYKMANLLEKSLEHVSFTLNHQLTKKYPVLLHTGTAVSNGFVSMAPSRSEWYLTSPQEGISMDWLTQLAIHEGRHIIQLNKLYDGVNIVMKILFGEAALGAMAGLFPLWAYEGDAVITETALTNTGRGRSSSFFMGLKAITFDQSKDYSFEKATFGSYKDFVPDHYVYGYALTSTARIKYDSNFWSQVLDYIPKRFFMLPPSYFSMKKYYGLSKRALYNQSMNYFKTEWEKTITKTTTYRSSNIRTSKEYTSYRYPQITDDGSIIAEKSNFSFTNRFVKIKPNGEEEIIKIAGFTNDRICSYANGLLVWAEARPHSRWELEDYSVLRVHNVSTGSTNTYGKKHRYFSPNISADGKKIVTVESGHSGVDYLVILDAETGKLLHKFPFEKVTLQKPSWDAKGENIVFTMVGDKGKSVELLDLKSGKTKNIIQPTFVDLSSPVFWKHYLLFSAAFNGTDNIYAFNRQDEKLYQVTQVKYGALDPSISTNNNRLYFSNYTSHGYDISYYQLDSSIFKQVAFKKEYHSEIVSKLQKQEPGKIEIPIENHTKYQVRKYKQFQHLFNVHSWMPFFMEPEISSVQHTNLYPGAIAFTQNLNSTLMGWMGYSYREGQHYGHLNLTYQRFLPVFSADFSIGGNPEIIRFAEEDNYPDNSIANKKTLSLDAHLPLSFSIGQTYIQWQPGTKYEYNDWYLFNQQTNSYEKGFGHQQYYNHVYFATRKAHRDLYPRWGIRSSQQFIHSPNLNFGSMYNYRIVTMMPGVLPNHSLRFTYQHQDQQTKNYYLPYSLPFPRGTSKIISKHLESFSADYSLPLFYPDWQWGNLFYFKRFSTNLFYDQALVEGIPTGDENNPFADRFYRSYGLELFTDVHIAQMFFPINIGVRLGYSEYSASSFIEPTLRIDLSGY